MRAVRANASSRRRSGGSSLLAYPLSSLAIVLVLVAPGCAGLKRFFGADNRADRRIPIENPFGEYYGTAAEQARKNVILRTKKGERSIEVELPGSGSDMTDFVVPVSPHFRDDRPTPTSDSSVDLSYAERKPSPADREIASTFPKNRVEDEGTRREIESELGVRPSEDETPDKPKSYLAALDRVKQLYRLGRYEAALLEIETLIPEYQSDPKLHKMRGTILDRLGHTQLAIKSWEQALKLEPQNKSLKSLVERKRAIAGGYLR